MGEEEENYKNEENNNFASTNHLSFDPNNNLPYFQDRQRGYNQIFNGDKHSFDFENEVENSPYYHYYGQRSGNPNIHQMDRQYQQQQHPFSGGPLNPQYHKSIVYPEGQRGGNNHKNFWFNNSNKLIINFWLLIIFYLIIQIIKI
ncbi:hypothetical protein Mgra_00007221 [Meloidogyne graminicola]|uniref:Transmembrane protein n=1 Tax=Meloidogyne graminicola TaxID=189291 RepID=A0A8S9ZJ48_9BILA|nr:hypothetical protein Mgra_00007221 [Meloidogyne graminicola]